MLPKWTQRSLRQGGGAALRRSTPKPRTLVKLISALLFDVRDCMTAALLLLVLNIMHNDRTPQRMTQQIW